MYFEDPVRSSLDVVRPIFLYLEELSSNLSGLLMVEYFLELGRSSWFKEDLPAYFGIVVLMEPMEDVEFVRSLLTDLRKDGGAKRL